MSTAQALSPSSRAESLKKLEETELDVLVIGGGVVGAGSALAATRGLKVGLVEARDFASGTSSRSSKLFTADCVTSSSSIALVFEALRERSLGSEFAVPASREAGAVHLPTREVDRPAVRRSGHRRLRRDGRRPRGSLTPQACGQEEDSRIVPFRKALCYPGFGQVLRGSGRLTPATR